MKHTVVYIFFEMINKGVPFLILPFLTHYLSPEDYGHIASYNVFVSFIFIFVGLSVHGLISVKFFKLERKALAVFISNGIVLSLLSAVIIFIFVWLLGDFIAIQLKLPRELLIAGVVMIFFQYLTLINLNLWIYESKPKAYGIYQFFQMLLNYGLIMVAVTILEYGWEGYVFANIIAIVLFGFLSLMILWWRRYIHWQLVKKHLKTYLSFGLPLIPHQLSGWVSTSGDKLLLISLVGSYATGLYQVGFQIGSVMAIVTSAVHKVWNPYIYKRLKEGLNREDKISIVKLSYMYFFGIVILVCVLYIGSIFVFEHLIAKDFSSSLQYTLLVLLAYAFNGMYFMVVSYIFYYEKTAALAKITSSIAILHVLTSFTLISIFGAIGAGYAMVISYALMFLIVWRYSYQVYPLPWLFWKV
jgi:O-antigen/teichoic acid export membrane protein